jgi:four helix bundle protein
VVSGQLIVEKREPVVARPNFENLDVYRLSEDLADAVWEIVINWQQFPRRTIGEQLAESADSIGANIAEGVGRGSFKDNRRFVRIARGSLNETQHWLRRAYRRKLLKDDDVAKLRPLIDELGPRLNAYLKSIGSGQDAGKSPKSRPGSTERAKADSKCGSTDNGQRTTDNQL